MEELKWPEVPDAELNDELCEQSRKIVFDKIQPTTVEIFGRKLRIVNDPSNITCNHCALNDICEAILWETEERPCEKANGETNRHFEWA